MTSGESTVSIAIAAAAVIITRFAPFMVFGVAREIPQSVRDFGKWLGPAVFGLLVIYCFKDCGSFDTLWPRLLAAAATMAVQIATRSMMLAMLAGTALYMIIVNLC
ncbi:MAG: AzlD domain-containing protein [Kiritimatiellae bacterium]|nr:AzlD domain-containing protein [Kiritimatiellia bacterium]